MFGTRKIKSGSVNWITRYVRFNAIQGKTCQASLIAHTHVVTMTVMGVVWMAIMRGL